LRLLDRYVTVGFLKVFAGALLLVSISGVTLDYVSRIGHFQESGVLEGTFAEEYSRLEIVLRFYAAYLPFLIKEVLPFVTVAAALFTLANMLRHNEVLPVVAAGGSARRLFLPLVVAALLVSFGHLAFQELVVPTLNREQIALKHLFRGDRRQRLKHLPHLRDGEGTVTCADSFSFVDGSLAGVVIQRPWGPAGFERWTAPMLLPAKADEAGTDWIATEGVTVYPAEATALPRQLPPGTHVDIGISWDEVDALASKYGTTELSLSQLDKLVDKFPYRRNLRVALHKQVSRPLTSFVMVLLGIPILLKTGRSLWVGGGIAFGLAASYYLLDIFFSSLGDRGDLSAVLAAYLPIAILFSLGVAAYTTLRT
jgi:lipopolysaccharide export system permease protein